MGDIQNKAYGTGAFTFVPEFVGPLHVDAFSTFCRTEHTPPFSFSYFWLATIVFAIRSMELGCFVGFGTSKRFGREFSVAVRLELRRSILNR